MRKLLEASIAAYLHAHFHQSMEFTGDTAAALELCVSAACGAVEREVLADLEWARKNFTLSAEQIDVLVHNAKQIKPPLKCLLP